ncbi:hemerythrin domain-containing protein [Thioalkalivibrio paradoxus]|uniref:Hemerythrin-like domain-containing protein n=1 Tax=Thioalkalivibrio paradoxus ARh 1 TaxID=713585 RepID=W0DIN6_9GAMM|nr:hemerythrin domain-containing protein [Thioalkalivibrio paradoxus]AHE98291.1 hypothetical protein THITH_08485 [Thioalkalivibrio paradoxus ARh 1]
MTANRSPQLERLYREHAHSLAFADRIEGLVADGSAESLAQGIQLVRDYYEQELEAHLQQEEQTLFGPLLQHDRENFALFAQLGKEHGFLRMVAANLRPETAERDLAAFADVLREHTRTEDERLLPLVEAHFTPEQLDAVMHFKPLPTAPIQRHS